MTADEQHESRFTLALRTASYAAFTVGAIAVIQALVIHPRTAIEFLVLLLPTIICPPATYVITRKIASRRAAGLLSVYQRLKDRNLDDLPTTVIDPEFRESRAVFVRLARELAAAQSALEQRDVDRRRLFSDVVHELGTPVSTLLGLAEALELPALAGTAEQRERLTRGIGRESERLARFVEDLRDISQLDDPQMSLDKQPVSLDELAGDVVARMNALPNATTVELRVEPVRLHADPSRLEQVFVNLVTNARRYAPAPAPIVVHVRTDGDRATITVEDGGPGVPEADLSKLGERMRRLDASRTRRTGGTGLGLSIVTAIADKHGGKVRYRRSSLGGLAVDVELERRTEP